MSLRVASLMAVACAACAASPLAAAEIPDSQAAGLRGLIRADPLPPAAAPTPAPPEPSQRGRLQDPLPERVLDGEPESTSPGRALAVPDDHPRRYSLHRDYGEQPDPTVLPPEFFLQSTPVAPDPAASAPTRDRHDRPVEAPAPDSPSA